MPSIDKLYIFLFFIIEYVFNISIASKFHFSNNYLEYNSLCINKYFFKFIL